MNHKTKNLLSTLKRLHPWLVWGLAASFFFTGYFIRISPSIIPQELMAGFDVHAFALGGLSACFYYAYVAMQIPVGILVDRFGTQRLLILALLSCTLGLVIFAVSHHIIIADFARALMGFGAAFAFVGTLKLVSTWFPPSKFAVLAGITQALGMLGAAVGDAPMALLFHRYGWRNMMWGIAAVNTILIILVIIFVRDEPASKRALNNQTMRTNKINVWRAFKSVIVNKLSWINALYVGCVFAPTAAFAGLWGISFFKRADHFTTEFAALDVGMLFVGLALGCPLFGWLSDVIGSRLKVMRFSALVSCILMCVMLYGYPLWRTLPSVLFVLLLVYGICNSGLIPSYALAQDINKIEYTGIALGFTNMASVIIGAFCIPIIGAILDLCWGGQMVHGAPVYHVNDYLIALSILPVLLFIAFLSSFWLSWASRGNDLCK